MLKILVTSRRCFFSTSSIKRRGLTPPSALRVAKSISPQQIETLKSRYKQPIERLLQSNKYKVGIISKPLLNVHLDNIANKDVIEELFIQNGLDKGDEIKQAIDSFRSFCLSDKDIGEELFDVIKKVLSFESHSDELFPYILRHAFQKNPGLVHHKIYKSYLDLSKPESYYPEARAMSRHIIYHYGPTNSGKTYTALEEFFKSKSAIYCSPLKLLAYEIYKKAKLKNCEIDLITGDEKIFEKSKDLPVNHMACTIEMADKDREFDLAIIDEVQMIGDLSRGNAWTQAILGLKCKEIHLCGDESGLDLVKRLSKICGDTFTSHKYDRLSQLIIEKNPLANVSQIRDGDCIVCFSKKYIYKISEILSENKIEHAIIYGTMPPAIKMEQSNKFNDPNSKTKVLVATDAIGMGLNL
ncbi:MAG: ATP-dependent RNA helicase supv3l1, mitochondrial [Marteilia pararefringens]